MIFSELQSHESYRYQRWSKCKLAVAQILLVAIFSVFAVSEIDTAYGAEPPMFPPLVPHVPPKAETLNKGNLVSKIGIQTLLLSPLSSPSRDIRVALLLPLSGAQAALGNAMLEASQLAMFEMATEQLTIFSIDTKGTPEGARSAAEQALRNGASLILGPLLARSVQAVSSVVSGSGINIVAFSNSRAVAGRNVFIMGFVPRQQVNTIVEYAARRGLRRLALMAPDNSYGKTVFRSLQHIASVRGIEIVQFAFYKPGANDFSNEIRSISDYDARRKALLKQRSMLEDKDDEVSKQALKRLENLDTIGEVNFDAILLPDTGPSMSVLAAQLAFFDVDQPAVRYLGLRSWDQIPNIEREPALRRAWFVAPSMHERRFFVERFSRIFGKPPPRLVSLAYDATALAAVLARSPGGPDFSRRALTNPNGFDGVDGLFRLGENGVAERAFSILEVRERGFRRLKRSPRTFQDYGH